MRRPGAAHSFAWRHHKREIQLGSRKLLTKMLKTGRRPTTDFGLLGAHQRLKHEAACCSTFSCLRTSQTRDSGGFQKSFSQRKLPTRLLKTLRQRVCSSITQQTFALIGAHQVGAVPDFYMNPNWTDSDKYTHLPSNLVFTGDSTESLEYDILQQNMLYKGHQFGFN
ncbi:hypothetical protein T265_03412 [Opisthorchis viverrini]|uniref:Uncharacterized protein n=1 Tax=Opisthorchis viverrini TaxID=6198 RepID=A0A074ZRI1_OPIVI|nr:hypothetical protein T265_03412 [Opisthorchis viverrini]KER30033.1 hypothetical protein T265_03412 [Opisthorchis viverrini]